MMIFTVGHSNTPMSGLVALLKRQNIEVLVDTRSQPYSRYAPQFNRETLEAGIRQEGILYLYMGDQLGGRPSGPAVYRSDGTVNYDSLSLAPFYREGIEKLKQTAESKRVSILCSEASYEKCHRHNLITRTLLQEGVPVCHILPSGELVEASLEQFTSMQLDLFD